MTAFSFLYDLSSLEADYGAADIKECPLDVELVNTRNLQSNDDDNNDESKAVGFAAQLAAMNAEDDAVLEVEDEEAFDSPTADTGVVGPEQRFDDVTGARPPLPPGVGVDPKKTVCMQLVDLDHMIEDDKVVVRLFGATREGNSVCAMLRGFKPYLYVQAPDGFMPEHVEHAIDELDRLVKASSSHTIGVPRDLKHAVLGINIVMGENLYGYNHNKQSAFLKVTIAVPKLVGIVRKVCQEGVRLTGSSGPPANLRCFEANVDFEIRFMVDSKINGCCWVELPGGKYNFVDRKQYKSRCQLEVSLHWESLVVHAPEGDWADIAPLRILSFDIECAGRRGVFPEANQDPVIQIANMVQLQGESKPFIRNIFTLGTCAAIVGSEIEIYHFEESI
uniref:DNA polymerase delta catalytic subunit n=1 Tax=Plectus sambesii TaxID=2011161 RepID=A0A914WK30_9BILA